MAEVIKINDNTWRIEDTGVRFYLLCGTERAALIDTGMNTPDARLIAEGLTSLPLILINTHADPDHISGNASFDSFYMSPNEEGNLRNHTGAGDIIAGRAEGKTVEIFGNEVCLYNFSFAGFLCDPEK